MKFFALLSTYDRVENPIKNWPDRLWAPFSAEPQRSDPIRFDPIESASRRYERGERAIETLGCEWTRRECGGGAPLCATVAIVAARCLRAPFPGTRASVARCLSSSSCACLFVANKQTQTEKIRLALGLGLGCDRSGRSEQASERATHQK